MFLLLRAYKKFKHIKPTIHSKHFKHNLYVGDPTQTFLFFHFQMTRSLSSATHYTGLLENYIVSVERIREYIGINIEVCAN